MGGGGWACSDFGKKLKDNLEDCGLLLHDFNLDYGFDGDRIEWSLTAYTAEWKDDCVADAAFNAGAPKYMRHTML